jgi:Protein of unknown function (DUF4038)/Putative collagen-binding domain of a collagenase
MVLARPKASRIWLLFVGIVVVGALCLLLHFRHQIVPLHDPGFPVITASRLPPDSHPLAKAVVGAPGQFMTLDPTGHFLMNSIIKKPVFITGDSAWSLITQLSDADVDTYLADRASRGFNYIWCAAADNYYQAHAPEDYYGDRPFDGPDFTHEDVKYWDHVDSVIRRAANDGITVALDPGFVGLTSTGGFLRSYQTSSDSVLTAYGEFLGNRYKGFSNLIWAIGGDVDPSTGVLPKLTALANGIRSEDKIHLMVAEGQPQHSSLDTYGYTNWMDLNWLYFHTTNAPSGAAVNYTRKPSLPPFEGEGWYEDEWKMTGLELREQGYWAVLSGAYLGNGGFGNSPLWYFAAGPSAKASDPTWKSQLASKGSIGQMYMGKLFRSREHWLMVPDLTHEIMTAGYDSRNLFSSIWETLHSLIHHAPYRLGSKSAVDARTSDGQTIIAYVPDGNASSVTIAMDQILDPEGQTSCWWFNPRDGLSLFIGDLVTRGNHRFTPPDANDWVLVIDSRFANLAAPGSADL